MPPEEPYMSEEDLEFYRTMMGEEGEDLTTAARNAVVEKLQGDFDEYNGRDPMGRNNTKPEGGSVDPSQEVDRAKFQDVNDQAPVKPYQQEEGTGGGFAASPMDELGSGKFKEAYGTAEPEMNFSDEEGMQLPASESPRRAPVAVGANGLPEGSRVQNLTTEITEVDQEGPGELPLASTRKAEHEVEFMSAMEGLEEPDGILRAMNTAQTLEELNIVDEAARAQGFDEGLASVASEEDIVALMNNAQTLEELERLEAEQEQFHIENPQGLVPQTDPQTSLQPGEQPQDPYAPGVQTTQSELERRAGMTPDQRLVEDAHNDARRREDLLAQREAKMVDQAEQQSMNLRILKESNLEAKNRTRTLLQQSEELSKREIDPNRWFKNRGAVSHMATFLSAAINGALNPGGPNQTLIMAQKAIDNDIDAQVQDLKNGQAGIRQREGLVAKLYSQGMSEFEAGETARISAYNRMDQELAIQAAKYDPMGTTVRNIERSRQEARQLSEAAELRLETHNVNLITKMRTEKRAGEEQRRKNLNTAADVQKKQLEAAMLRKKLTRRSGPGRPKPRSLADAISAQKNNMIQDANGNWIPDPNYDPKTAPKDLETQKVEGDIEGQKQRTRGLEQKHALVEDSLTVDFGDDNEFVAKTPKMAETLNAKKPAVEAATVLLDDVLALANEHGTEPFGSQAGKNMDAKMTQLTFVVKDISKGGALDQGLIDTVRVAAMGGEKLPSKTLRKFNKAMEGFRKQMVDQINLEAEQAIKDKKKFKKWDPPMRATEKARRKTKSERYDAAAQGIPLALRGDPKARASAVALAKTQSQWIADNDNPTIDDLTGLGSRVKQMRDEEGYTTEESVEILMPVAAKVADSEYKRLSKETHFGSKFKSAMEGKGEQKYKRVKQGKRKEHLEWLDRVRSGDEKAAMDFILNVGSSE